MSGLTRVIFDQAVHETLARNLSIKRLESSAVTTTLLAMHIMLVFYSLSFSTSKMTCIISGGVLNAKHSLIHCYFNTIRQKLALHCNTSTGLIS